MSPEVHQWMCAVLSVEGVAMVDPGGRVWVERPEAAVELSHRGLLVPGATVRVSGRLWRIVPPPAPRPEERALVVYRK